MIRRSTILLALGSLSACGGSGSPNESPSTESKEVGSVASAALDIVFNEVASVGSSEWIEIGNKGSSAVDASGYAIADSDKKTGGPRLTEAMRFPKGTTIEPHGRILVLTSKKGAPVGPHPKAECVPNGPETCLFAPFGVSATSGESLHLLAPDGSVVTSTATPKTASADAGGTATETQCRLPDLTGDFATCVPTPGEANRVSRP